MKRRMHKMSNIISIFLLIPIMVIGSYFIYRDAANDTLRYVGVATIIILCLGFFILMAIKFKVFAYIVFEEKEFVVKGFLCKEIRCLYEHYFAIIGSYTDIFTTVRAIILNPINGAKLKTIDTRKFGNLVFANENNIFYCMLDDEILKFLNEKF